MANQQLPSDFNWVKERYDCSPAKVFKQIELGVKEDIATIQRVCPGSRETFDVVGSRNRFVAIRIDDPITSTISEPVSFELTRTGIKLFDTEGKLKLEATLTLNLEGECRLNVGDQELVQWQFRKLVLERLFFGPR
jgi:hypothetical protein